jgi:RNA polymerase sigma factor (sigma-70 family)
MTPFENQMIVDNMPLVYSIAKKYKNTTMPQSDIIQEGMLGLIYAVTHYHGGKTWGTYAYRCIDGYIKNALYQNRLIAIPIERQKQLQKLQSYTKNYENKYGIPPTEEEQQEYLKVNEEEYKIIMQANMNTTDCKTNEKDLINNIPDTTQTAEQQIIHQEEIEEQMLPIYQKFFLLNHKQQQCIILLYGLFGGKEYSIKETAKEMGLTSQQINLLKHQSLQILKGGG